jgi:Family of unknown function (DUF6516)
VSKNRPKKVKPLVREVGDTYYMRREKDGIVVTYEAWAEHKGGPIITYRMAYINPFQYGGDNGRVLGYDCAHGYHHRHFRGEVTAVEYVDFSTTYERFVAEVSELWKEYQEDE